MKRFTVPMLAAVVVLALATACATTDPAAGDTSAPTDAAPAGAEAELTQTATPDGLAPGPSPTATTEAATPPSSDVPPAAPAEPTPTATSAPTATALPSPTATPLVRPPYTSGNLGFVPLDDPEVLSAAQATYLSDDAMVLGLESNGEARAYPLEMMWYHHITNDILGGDPVLVTF